MCQALEAHTYNPSYSGGINQESRGLKLAWANSLWDPISKNPSQKYGWRSGSGWRPRVQTPVTHPPQKKKKKKKKKERKKNVRQLSKVKLRDRLSIRNPFGFSPNSVTHKWWPCFLLAIWGGWVKLLSSHKVVLKIKGNNRRPEKKLKCYECKLQYIVKMLALPSLEYLKCACPWYKKRFLTGCGSSHL
jgi:hypothetical protein